MTEEKNTVEKSETRKAADPEIEPGEVVEEELVEGAKVRRKGIYLLPNALTTASLFSGFYAIVSAANGVFDNAAIAIFVSMIQKYSKNLKNEKDSLSADLYQK